jgi:hypothetical protein
VLVVVSLAREVGWLGFMVGVVTSLPVVGRAVVLPVQFCWVSGGGSDGFSSFFVLLVLSLLRMFFTLSASSGAGVVCVGSGACNHSESSSSDLLSVAKSCLCW